MRLSSRKVHNACEMCLGKGRRPGRSNWIRNDAEMCCFCGTLTLQGEEGNASERDVGCHSECAPFHDDRMLEVVR